MKIRSNRKMKSKLGLYLFVAAFSVSAAEAAPRLAPVAAKKDFGLGVILGDPTGITGKSWASPNAAYDFGFAFNFGDYFLLYADYLHHFNGQFGNTNEFTSNLTPYVGIGALLAFSTDDRYRRNRNSIFKDSTSSMGAGIRIPLGLEWRPAREPIGVFVELVPGLAIVPGTSAFFQGGIGARYYF